MSARPNLFCIDGNGEIDEDLVPIMSNEAALLEVVAKQRSELAAVRARLAKMAEVDPDAETIQQLLEYWRDRTGRNRKTTKLPVDGRRWRIIKARLREDHEPEDLKRAFDAVAAFPWESYGRRYAEPAPDRRKRSDVFDAIGDEAKTEANIRLAAGDGAVQSYRWYLHRLTVEKPWMVHALAMLGEHEWVHGEVLASAVRWASTNGGQGADGLHA